MTDVEKPAEWAWKRCEELAGLGPGQNLAREYPGHVAFARYIEVREEPPVDPLLIEAREICADYYEGEDCGPIARKYRNGEYDDSPADPEITIALAALRRGIELGSNTHGE